MTFWFLKFSKKTTQKFDESKKWLNQKDEGTLLYVWDNAEPFFTTICKKKKKKIFSQEVRKCRVVEPERRKQAIPGPGQPNDIPHQN